MTISRLKIESSLAQRGRPAMWANEQEAAVLSGVGIETYRRKVAEWDKRGFPRTKAENGRRSIPAILAFWGLPQNHTAGLGMTTPDISPTDDDFEDGQENWHG